MAEGLNPADANVLNNLAAAYEAELRLWSLWSAKWLLLARLVELHVNVPDALPPGTIASEGWSYPWHRRGAARTKT